MKIPNIFTSDPHSFGILKETMKNDESSTNSYKNGKTVPVIWLVIKLFLFKNLQCSL